MLTSKMANVQLTMLKLYLLKKMGQDLRGFLNWWHHMASEAPYSPHRV